MYQTTKESNPSPQTLNGSGPSCRKMIRIARIESTSCPHSRPIRNRGGTWCQPDVDLVLHVTYNQAIKLKHGSFFIGWHVAYPFIAVFGHLYTKQALCMLNIITCIDLQ